MADVATLDGTRIALNPGEIAALGDLLRGKLLLAQDHEYDRTRRVWNGNIDRYPALIARCTVPADVQQVVNFARNRALLLSVRGGGHSAPGYGTCDGGIVIDLSPMKGISVDAGKRSADAQGGVLWCEFDRETQVHGLATTGGTVSNTGVGGLTLGGGLGWLMGKHGLTIDNLLSADVVTADGQLRNVSEAEHPDLFWALRGGSGNFGVVTRFEYRLHPVADVLGGMVIYPLDQAASMLRFYREFCSTLPDEAEAYAALLTLPDGIPVAAMLLGYNGSIAEGERVLAPARHFGRPLADLVSPMPYSARQTLMDTPNAEHGLHRYWRAAFTDEISDALIDVVVASAARFSSPLSAFIFFHMHGAAARVQASATAFASRRPQWDFDAIGQWRDGLELASHIAWLRDVWSRAEPHLPGSAYVNHIAADDRPEKVRASYGENYRRLRELKAEFDPTNLFRLNPNILPASDDRP